MQTYCVIGTCGRMAALCAYVTALAWGADPALTIYNQNFAVVRDTVPLDLKAGAPAGSQLRQGQPAAMGVLHQVSS